MSRASFVTSTAAAVSIAFTQSAFSAELIDNPQVAQTVANYITAHCPVSQAESRNPEVAKACIAAGADMSNSLAREMGKYIDEVSIINSPFAAGMAKGDLMSFCFAPMQTLGEREYSNLGNYLDAAFNAVKSCEESMVRAGEAVDIDYQATARNTVSCHMNRLKGLSCE
jgi:hypothetical protein